MQQINAKAKTKQDEKVKMEAEYKEARGTFRKITIQSKEKKWKKSVQKWARIPGERVLDSK